MTDKSQLGQLGEDLACEYLLDKGYKIIGRNIRQPWGELDIVAKYKDGTLVFMEVKTMQQYPKSGLKPEDQLTKAKLRKTQKAASLYAGHYPEKINGERGWRIDLLAIGLKMGSEPEIKHYENIG